MTYRRYRCVVCGFVSSKTWRPPYHASPESGDRCFGTLGRIELSTEELTRVEAAKKARYLVDNAVRCRRNYWRRKAVVIQFAQIFCLLAQVGVTSSSAESRT